MREIVQYHYFQLSTFFQHLITVADRNMSNILVLKII